MAAKPKKFDVQAHPLMQDDPDALTAEETAAAQAESQGAALETTAGDETVAQQGAEQVQPKPVAPPAEEPAETREEFIPRPRFDEVYAERNRLRQELAQQQEQWTRLDERRRTMQAMHEDATRTAEQARVAATRPDPDVDLRGAQLWDLQQANAQLAGQVQQLSQQFQSTGQQTAQQLALRDLETWSMADVNRVRAIHPDYDQALNHLRTVRINLNTALGYTPEQAEALWNLEVAAYTRQARDNNRSIADFAYQMAQAVGYHPPQAGQAPANGAVRQVTGEVMPSGRERVAQLERAQRMQGLGGKVSSAEGEPYANIKTMTAQQFAAWLDNKFPDGEDLLELKNSDPAFYKVIEQRMAELG